MGGKAILISLRNSEGATFGYTLCSGLYVGATTELYICLKIQTFALLFWYTDFYSLGGAVEFREFSHEVECWYCHSSRMIFNSGEEVTKIPDFALHAIKFFTFQSDTFQNAF